ncbi:MAG: DnaJ domain-containing protein [Myxococcota bacterium]
MSDRLDQLDYYTLLGLEPGADADAVRDGFRTFALKYHPDNHGGAERAAQIFRRGTEAYRVLRDPSARARYDEGLRTGELRLGEPKKAKVARLGLKAKPFYDKARTSLRQGDRANAKLHLKLAMGYEPDHPELLKLQAELDE